MATYIFNWYKKKYTHFINFIAFSIIHHNLTCPPFIRRTDERSLVLTGRRNARIKQHFPTGFRTGPTQRETRRKPECFARIPILSTPAHMYVSTVFSFFLSTNACLGARTHAHTAVATTIITRPSESYSTPPTHRRIVL